MTLYQKSDFGPTTLAIMTRAYRDALGEVKTARPVNRNTGKDETALAQEIVKEARAGVRDPVVLSARALVHFFNR